MKKCIPFLLLLLPFVKISAEELELKSIVHFDGTSTLHDFSGMATSKVSRVTWTPATRGGTLSAPTIVFDVNQVTTDHKKRDKNMMKMFKPGDFPLITGSLKEWPLGNQEKSETVLRLKIQNMEVEVPVTVTDYKEDENGIHFTGRFTLSLKSFGLKRPSALGVIRVGDEITLKVETHLNKSEWWIESAQKDTP